MSGSESSHSFRSVPGETRVQKWMDCPELDTAINTRSDDWVGMIRRNVGDLSLPPWGGTEITPPLEVFFEGSTFVGKRKFYGRVIFQPRGKKIDLVLDMGRSQDEIVETTIDLAKKSVQMIQLREISGRTCDRVS